MKRVVSDVQALLGAFEDAETVPDEHLLWDEYGSVAGGRNWSAESKDIRTLHEEGYLSISGPLVPEPLVDW